jgi:hypothetical protein
MFEIFPFVLFVLKAISIFDCFKSLVIVFTFYEST